VAFAGKSEFYPPRARRALKGRLRWYRLRALCRLEDVEACLSRTPFQLALGMLFPPYAFCAVRSSRWRAALLILYPLLALIFLACLGLFVGNIAFGLMLSIHAGACQYLWEMREPAADFRERLLRSTFLLVAISLFIYWPARELVTRRLFFPMVVENRVLVMSPLLRRDSIKQGDWMAYRLPKRESGPHEAVVIVRSGLDVQRVLALPGDRIEFGPRGYRVNGRPFAREEGMPNSGELIVPNDDWFVWPNLSSTLHGKVPAENIASMLFELSLVPQSAYRGRVFHRWFWREQMEK